jgi:hypothetical protein
MTGAGAPFFVSRKDAKILKMASQTSPLIPIRCARDVWGKSCALDNLCAFA